MSIYMGRDGIVIEYNMAKRYKTKFTNFSPLLKYEKVILQSRFLKYTDDSTCMEKLLKSIYYDDEEHVLENLQLYDCMSIQDSRILFKSLEHLKGLESLSVCWEKIDLNFKNEKRQTLLHQSVICNNSSIIYKLESLLNQVDVYGKCVLEYLTNETSHRVHTELRKYKMPLLYNIILGSSSQNQYNPNDCREIIKTHYKLKHNETDCKLVGMTCFNHENLSLPDEPQYMGYNFSIDPIKHFAVPENLSFSIKPNILSMSGGGVKMYPTLLIMMKNNIDFSECHTFCGASAGALLIMLLIKYNFCAKTVFHIVYRIHSHLYTTEGLRYYLESIFKDELFVNFHNELKIKIYITCNGKSECVENCTTQPAGVETQDLQIHGQSEWRIVDLLLATSAFPFIFYPMLHQNNVYVDGGLTANNPLDRQTASDQSILSFMQKGEVTISKSIFDVIKSVLGNTEPNKVAMDSIAKQNNCLQVIYQTKLSAFEKDLNNVIRDYLLNTYIL